MRYKNLGTGDICILDKDSVKLGLQTCVGTILYGNNKVGVAHGLIPSDIGSGYANKLDIVPVGVEHLIRQMERYNPINSINAILVGGKIEASNIGIQNSQQAREILKKLQIPIKMDFTKNNYWDTELMVHPNKFEINAVGFPSKYTKNFEEL